MGGSALKHIKTRRYESGEFELVKNEIITKLNGIGFKSAYALRSYTSKESHGDLDILLDSNELPTDWKMKICKLFELPVMQHPDGRFTDIGNHSLNSHIYDNLTFTVHYGDLQVDFTPCNDGEYETSKSYYDFNDLGNLLGIIFKQFGLKFGHDGLSYNWRPSPTVLFRNFKVSTNLGETLKLIGLDVNYYAKGFATRTDIFDMVMSSPYFTKEIYLLHNRNNRSRVRDTKRSTYTEFLNYIKDYDPTSEQVSNYEKLHDTVILPWNLRSNAEEFALEHINSFFPNFKNDFDETERMYNVAKESSSKFNGDRVSEWTGLTGKNLSRIMSIIRQEHGDEFNEWVVTQTDEGLREVVMSTMLLHGGDK